jgi:hypothetical protein
MANNTKTADAYLEQGPKGWFCVALAGGPILYRAATVTKRTLCWAEGTEEPTNGHYLPKTVKVMEVS